MSYSRRQLPLVIRESEASNSEDNWMNEFEKNLERNAVEPRREKSIYEQIVSIMDTKKSKFSSVEAAVNDMQERSGLVAYRNKVKQSGQSYTNKLASKEPLVFVRVPAIKKTIENFIQDTKGNSTIPAIVGKIKELHRNDIADPKDWEDDNLIIFISNMNMEEKNKNSVNDAQYNNLGRVMQDAHDADIDPSNDDAFRSLLPATK